jgi:polar amino acid transport system substrate-binding protein
MKRIGILGLAVLASLGMAQTKIGNCEVTGPKGQFPIRPAVAGQLTVQTNLPGPGFWNGDSPATIKDGFEYCLAANIAHRAGLDKVVVQNVAWDALIAGQTRNFDFALSQITITEARKRVVDFSRPYFSSDIGVLVRAADKAKFNSPASLKTARLGVQQATTEPDPGLSGCGSGLHGLAGRSDRCLHHRHLYCALGGGQVGWGPGGGGSV